MLSIGLVLKSYKNHLPASWIGLRSLFPPGYSGSISLLAFYVIFVYRKLATYGYGEDAAGQSYIGPSCWGNFWLGADGQGRWFFAWIYGNSDRNFDPRQGGFVFKFSPEIDGRGYGIIDTSRPPVHTLSCNSGTDDVIRQHWPQILSGGGRIVFQAPPGDLNPSDVWTEEGFTTAISLNGSHVPPAQGVASGSGLFPFPPTVPANALNPPSATLLGPPPDPDDSGGGSVDSPSYSILDPAENPNDGDIGFGGFRW